MGADETYEFGPFMLNVTERRLTRSGRQIALPPKAFDLLAVLVRRAGHLVPKADLLDQVWPDAHVEEGILAVHVSTLRKALANGEAGCIETVPRAGYRFRPAVVHSHRTSDVMSLRWPVNVLLPSRPALSELLGRGRGHLLTGSRAEIPEAVEAFGAAIALEQTCAAAHAGLALAWCAQAELRLAPAPEAYRHARDSALRALAMDGSCADAQVALGTVLFLSDWNWAGAERSLLRAIALDPENTDAWLLYGRLLDALGRLDSGSAAKHKALERSPRSAQVHLQIAHSYWNQRRYDEVIAWAQRALELDAGHLLAREYVAGAYLKKGDGDRHMAETLAHAECAGAPSELLDTLRRLYDAGGRPGIVSYALDQASRHNPPAMQLALLFGEAGDLDQAFRHLDRAIEARDPCLVDLAVAPQWDLLRDDARFDERLALMGLRAPVLRRRP